LEILSLKKTENGNLGVTVIIPTLNEENNLVDLFSELSRMGYHNILVVDANSRDRTVEIAKEFGANIIIQNGKGKGAALRQAFESDGLNGDRIVIMDADGSMSPKEIPRLIEALDSGADVIKGSRFLPFGYSEDLNTIRRMGNLLFLLLVNLLWSTKYTDLCYGFGVFRRDAIKKLCQHLKSVNFEIEAEICIKAKKLGLKVKEVPSMELRRNHGKSNLSVIRDGFLILKTIVKELGKRT
jgi:glycosyltransferase involved in cell wall biosynthesis